MKNELLALAASLALVSSMSASITNHSTKGGSMNLEASRHQCGFSLMAREAQPGDPRGKGQDPTGHKFTQDVAREAEPGDKKGKGQDGTGHKLV